MRRKTTDPPWINATILRRQRQRRAVYRREGRSAKWKRLKKVVEKIVKKRKEVYEKSQKLVLLEKDAERHFFKNCKNYQAKERPQPFDVRTLLPDMGDMEVAEKLADFFNKISAEFTPLEPQDIPQSHRRGLPTLEPFQVAGRLKVFKKPKSMVQGDVFPVLVTKFADLLAIPLTDIYNCITTTKVWP